MIEAAKQWRRLVSRALTTIVRRNDSAADPILDETLLTETPKPELGDLAFPMFPYAKLLRSSPQAIADRVREQLLAIGDLPGAVEVVGPYLNVSFPKEAVSDDAVHGALLAGSNYGSSKTLAGQRIMVEYSSPNTNKPLHLGHLRNDALGASVVRILRACGADVNAVNLVNDRGIHICKSMVAYREFGGGTTPATTGQKSDHFVGDYYVKYDAWSKSDERAEREAREMLKQWEAGDSEVRSLWRTMTDWAVTGIEATYARTGVGFDRIYFESETFEFGRLEVLRGLSEGIFKREEDGSVTIDLADIGLDKKVLLRSDGTTVYMTQDIGTAIFRQRDFPFDRLIYVVASEQQYHFRVLFEVLRRLGYPWATRLHHLSYGMVNLPDGRMKSREGTVVDADDLLDELASLAAVEVREKGKETESVAIPRTAESIALGALNYYLLQVNPVKDMVFDPSESISFLGNSGPYLQYMATRIASMRRRFDALEPHARGGRFRAELLTESSEWALVKLIAEYPAVVERAAEELNPSVVATFLRTLASTFSGYYHDTPVLRTDDVDLTATRMRLAEAVGQVLANGFLLLGIPSVDRM